MEPILQKVRDWLAEVPLDSSSPHLSAVQKAVFLARRLQEQATALQTPAERRQQLELDCLLQHPGDKATFVRMTDQAFRAREPHRAVDHLIHILDVQGVPRCFSLLDRTLLKGFQSFGGWLPGVALPLVKEHMHKETANVILPAEPEVLTEHLHARAEEGVRMNVNFLGEAILGEAEAARRLDEYLAALHLPEIEVVSIKISTLYSQISALAREHTVATLCDRLERLIRAAAGETYRRPDGSRVPKFVYLDMEEYADMSLTAAVFMRTLDRPGLQHAPAGLALQSYIPDSFRTLVQVLGWARKRVDANGAPVTIRLVKGANLEMERVSAASKGWPQAPFQTKRDTDANYKRMLHELLRPENLPAVRVGVASHNLFDLAYGLALAEERGALQQVQFEMLEGMANHQRRALFALCRNMLLYAPACRQENFLNAIGYLIRRLDENTGPENFLRHAFRLRVGSPDWHRLEQAFLDSCVQVDAVSDAPRRTQNRRQPPPETSSAIAHGWEHFVNEPDTDFAMPVHSEWAEDIITTWQPLHGARAASVPLILAGEEVFADRTRGASGARSMHECLDPSRPGVVVGRYPQATEADVTRAVECAVRDEDGWRKSAARDRFAVLGRVAQGLRQARADLVGAAIADGGKTIAESDPEVSEAVDFVEFYRETARWFEELPSVRSRGKGVVVVVSPWNFPIAIPCGGVAAALAAGNTVILKPSSDAVLVAYELCQCFWRAGVSRRVLQFLPCAGGSEGRRLVQHRQIAAVILTGGTATALAMLRDNPALKLSAETGGKNATIVTALADRDQAIQHVVHSAFSHSGQKCSATSLLLLEAEVYDDPAFRRTLSDAVSSIRVGSAWELPTRMGPLIRPPAGSLARALTHLDPGEDWAVAPSQLGDNPNLWSPGVKYGVRSGSVTHLTELFGPVLGVMRYEKLAEAVAIVNQTGYGLTSGLESLDERDWAYWREHIRAGNLYINRVTTGAIVLRQPFGGMGKSAFGPALKAGGPNYVAQFMDFTDTVPEVPEVVEAKGGVDRPASERLTRLWQDLRAREVPDAIPLDEVVRIETAGRSFLKSYDEEFGREHDHFRLPGQDNLRRYLPVSYVRIRVHPVDTPFELFARVCAAHVMGSRITVSAPPNFTSTALSLLEEATESWGGAIEFVEESDAQLAQAIRNHQTDRVRYAAPDRVPAMMFEAAAEAGVFIADTPVLSEGRIELLWYLREQSLSLDYHRYGNLGARAAETRAIPG